MDVSFGDVKEFLHQIEKKKVKGHDGHVAILWKLFFAVRSEF